MSELKKIAMWLGIFIGSGLTFLVVLFIIASMLTSGLKKPILKQLDAIRSEDAAAAYAYTSRAFQEATPFETFKKFINEYSALRNNESISFDERSIDNGIGTVNATLTSRSKAKTPIYYRLVKENDTWKIENMVINPGEDVKKNSIAATSKPTDSNMTSADPEPAIARNAIAHTFQEPRYQFSMGYPDGWNAYQPASGMVVFNDQANKSNISLQTLATYPRRSVDKFVHELTTVVRASYPQFQILQDAYVPSMNGNSYQARYIAYQYTVNNVEMSQLDVIYFKKPSKALYFFEFKAPTDQFNKDLPLAKAMVETFMAP